MQERQYETPPAVEVACPDLETVTVRVAPTTKRENAAERRVACTDWSSCAARDPAPGSRWSRRLGGGGARAAARSGGASTWSTQRR